LTQPSQSLSDDEEHAFMETESELESMGIGIIVEREGEEEEEGQQEASNMEDVDDSESAFEGHTDSVYSVDVATFNGTQIAASGGGDSDSLPLLIDRKVMTRPFSGT
jgi:hypothetical protein